MCLLGARAFGAAIWGGGVASPFIGMAVGRLLQGPFERKSTPARVGIALASVYLGATLFGLAIGIGVASGLTAPARQLTTATAEAVASVWWGVTLTGFLLFLWPLAYWTHWLIEWRTEA